MIQHGIEFDSLSKVKFLRLSWSNRKIEEFELTKSTVLQKCIVSGNCIVDEKVRPFLMKMNLENSVVDVIKVLKTEDTITAIGYGPFDNGYLIVGMHTGHVVIFDTITLDKIS